MKLNAAAEMLPLSWNRWLNIHPFVPKNQAIGYEKVLNKLENQLKEITGFDAVSLQPNSGAQGEYAGLMVIKSFHENNGDFDRNICLIPSSAHGTNPASAVMAGMQVVVVNSSENGNIDINDLEEKALQYKDRLGALMITYPSTHGVFESDILKITKIKTNEPLQDSSGNELTNANINWNDANNTDWYDQWLTICNSVFNATNKFGTPTKAATISSIKTEIYNLNSSTSQSAVKNFSQSVDGVDTSIDVVKADIHKNGYLYERSPDTSEAYNFIYRNDNQGFGSVDTGFFMYFKEGDLGFQDYTFSNPLPNRTIDLEFTNINDIDVWVQKINTNGVPTEKWEAVPGLFGQNTIYNSLALNTRNIFAVNSKNNDQVSVLFSDGNFGNAPKGSFRIYVGFKIFCIPCFIKITSIIIKYLRLN